MWQQLSFLSLCTAYKIALQSWNLQHLSIWRCFDRILALKWIMDISFWPNYLLAASRYVARLGLGLDPCPQERVLNGHFSTCTHLSIKSWSIKEQGSQRKSPSALRRSTLEYNQPFDFILSSPIPLRTSLPCPLAARIRVRGRVRLTTISYNEMMSKNPHEENVCKCEGFNLLPFHS